MKTKVSIIGLGNFGTLMASILSKHFDVLVYHYREDKDIEKKAQKIGATLVSLEEAANSDVVILSVPISKTREMIKQVSALMKSGALLLDTCSVKAFPCKWLKENTRDDLQIMGTHPMFGPTTSKFDLNKQSWQLSGLQIVLCPLRIEEKLLESIKKFLVSLDLKLIETTPEEHDKQNAKTLSFVHFVGRSLLASGIGHQEIYTPGYVDLLSILPHTTSDNWQLFFDMNNYNPYSAELRETFRDKGLDIEEKIIRAQDKDTLQIEREIIDMLDSRIMKLLKKRFESVSRVKEYKKKNNMEIVDKAREEAIIKEKRQKFDLSDEFIEEFYKLILKESRKLQQ